MRKYLTLTPETEGSSHSSVAEIQLMFNLIFKELVSSGYFRFCPTDDDGFKIYAVYGSAIQKQNTENEFYIYLTDADKIYLINHATALYLSEWLACDENAKQTINSFAIQKFCAKDEIRKRSRGADVNAGERSLYNRAAQKYRDMMLLQQLQAKEEGHTCKSADFIQYYQENNSSTAKSSKSGILYGFSDLCFINWIAEYSFTLYDLLVYSTDFMRKSNQERNTAIREAYKNYFKAVEELKGTKDDRLYTISSIMMQQIESTFGHMSAASLARFFRSCPELDIDDHINNTEFLWKRLVYVPFQEKTGRPITDYPCLFWTFSDAVKYLSHKDVEAQVHADMHLLLSRGLLTEMLMYANVCMHPSRRRSWTSADYHHAAVFFKELHPIVEQHPSLELGDPEKWASEECDFIRKFYEHMFPSGLEKLRAEAQKTMKERNSRYNNKRQST